MFTSSIEKLQNCKGESVKDSVKETLGMLFRRQEIAH